MKKHVFRISGLLVLALFTALTVYSCGKSSSNSQPNNTALIKQASDALTNGDPLKAKSSCTTVLKSDPTNCSCQWIYALADLQDLTQTQLQGIVDNLITALMSDNIGSLFTGVSMDLSDIPTRTSVIESNACEFTLPTLPVTVKLDFSALKSMASGYINMSAIPDTINTQLMFGSQWGPAEAKVLGSASNSLLAVINMVSAHALDTNDLISAVSTVVSGGLSLSMSDPIGLLRNLGVIFVKAPTLLDFNKQNTGPQDITSAGNEINAALKEINGLNASLQLDQGNPAKVISYKDVNGDGMVDGGDTFTVGALYYTNSTWVNIVQYLTGGETITIPAMVSDKAMPAIDALLNEFSDNLTNGTPSFKPMDLNPLLEAVGLTAVSFQTNVISLDPHAFFASPKPARYFFPTINNNSQFQIEAEVALSSTMPTIGWYYTNTDSSHFTDGTKPIVADGISVPVTAANLFTGSLLGMQLTIPPMIPYISFNDPTMDGVLSIDLSQMLEFCEPSGTCPASTPAGFSAATNYSLNKIIAGGIYGLFTDSTTGQPFTTTNPIW